MVFAFAPSEQFNFLSAFGERVGAVLQGNTLTLPSSLGEGSIKRVRLAPGFSMLIHQYTLTEELVLQRLAADNTADRVNVLFQIRTWPATDATANNATRLTRREEYAVRITSPDINSELRFPPNVALFFTVLSMSRPELRNLLKINNMNAVVAQILQGSQAFLFDETMSVDAQKTLKQLAAVDTQQELGELRIWIRVQELLGWLFDRLLAREILKHRPVHRVDAEQLSRVRSAIMADLSVPPQLPQLAGLAGMSVSKLTDLYKQVFGDSIYDYFQKARMQEAGYLLKQGGYSVSETGYRLGFSNLSHFSRLFEKHYGINPKRFTLNT
ncbi:helix-turn-helix transcriptional regulator [Fibrella sp. HMF5335]|uniref:Helix-turn-helix transcriptional regulator n=1 Tax=Fibrella rubiginis TaxID=2817060 RepID=A0A939GDV5_9BACT|nr:AraC family transcriptional regulator [Fibrella rubiginis]MBO0936541.1 helix-turn-helix transcriptional regulator [Fibrella rubiginis]